VLSVKEEVEVYNCTLHAQITFFLADVLSVKFPLATKHINWKSIHFFENFSLTKKLVILSF
jgi:hypothetical protein